MKTPKLNSVKVHIGSMGGVRVDADEFLAQPEMQRKIKIIESIDIVGRTLDESIALAKEKPRASD